LQWIVAASMTLGVVFLSWADMSRSQMAWQSFPLPVRTTLSLGLVVFLQGWLLPRRISADSSWLVTVRSATVPTSLAALCALLWLVATEIDSFVAEVGSGVPLASALAVSLMVGAMISGLVAIAVLPRHDPLSLSLAGRRGYVYLAQAVAALLVVHLYLTMPWLFQLGIRQYWPYVAMLLAFGGVAMAHLLGKRDLEVLAEPIFHSAAAIPVVAAAAYWAIDSKADASLLMLLAGMLYLTISMTRHGLLAGLAAVLFGNFALWLFYDKFPGMAFLLHPQFWLIPPALSVLIAGQLHRQRFTAGQFATLRYVSVAVIYLSCTSEIFITGLATSLWPPMGLATLAVLGILAGMMLRVRAFLYLGSVFLLLAMITMVAHAQQRLAHVWPWWAFGLVLGSAILVMFGLFEKRRNDMQSILHRLRKWDY
jgi:hypothetical protein